MRAADEGPDPENALANVKLPDPLARRHLLEGTIDPGKARSIGEAYLAAEREIEAAARTHSVCMPPTKQIVHGCITASLGGVPVLSGACAWREALRTFYLAG